MLNHPAIDNVTKRIVSDVIGGAADTAKEVLEALGLVISDSKATTVNMLYVELDQAACQIMKICPSLAPPINVLHMIFGALETEIVLNSSTVDAKRHLLETKERILHSMELAMGKISSIGAELIKNDDKVFMYSMSSSIWRVLRKAKEKGKRFTVLVTESRPANEGLWTVDEMNKSDIPVEVSIDACLSELVARSDLAFGGADAVGADGSVLNKTGTYLAALVAKEYGVPFYFVSDTMKFDTSTLLGLPFRSDPIHFSDILGNKTYNQGVKVVGKLFDVTPPNLITGIVTEMGIIPPSSCVNVMWKMNLSKRISELIPEWAYGNH